MLRALKAIGLRESKAVRKVNGLVLGKLLVEHDNYQDHVAENEKLKAIKSRVRTYQIGSGVTQERRDQLVRAAEREASMLSVLSDHPNIQKLKDYVAQGPTGAPCLVFDHFEDAQPSCESRHSADGWVQMQPLGNHWGIPDELVEKSNSAMPLRSHG